MAVDTVVKNCRVVSPEGITREGIAIQDGKIAAVAEDDYLPQSNHVIDAKGKYVIPGVIDVHVHYGVYHAYDEEVHDMNAAAIGGTTTCGCFVGLGASAHKGSYTEVFDKWRECWEQNTVIDAFFHGGMLSQTNIDEVMSNAKRYGITSHKVLMTCKGEETKLIGGDTADDGFLWAAFKAIAGLGGKGRMMCHAENIDIIARIMPAIRATNRQDLAAWAEARPGWCETLDVQRGLAIAKVTDCPLYFVHIHYPDSIRVIAQAMAEGIDVVAETCPQYLLLNTSSPVPAPLARIAPPVRDESCNEAMWQAINEGVITCIGSDHCSVTTDMCKELWSAPQGAPGVETLLPVMLSEGVNKGRITLTKLVELLCRNNARTFGIYPQKGTIQVGADADLVIVDMEKEGVIRNSNLHYRISDYSCFDGLQVKGLPVLTMVRGNTVVEDGRLVGKPGTGIYISRKSA